MIDIHEDFYEIGHTGESGDSVYVCSNATGAPHEITKAKFIEYYEQVSGTLYKLKDEYKQAVL